MSQTALIYQKDLSGTLLKPELKFAVQRYSHHATGGPKLAELEVQGGELALCELLDMLRCPIEIVSSQTERVWWGFIAEVEIRQKWLTIGLSLDSMFNRIAVAYSYVEPGNDQAGTRKTTTWIQDDDSVSEFGVKEMLYSLSGTTDEHALAARAMLLASKKRPSPKITLAEAEQQPGARVVCRGWWSTLEWQYYSRDAGLEVNSATDSDQPIGQALTSSALSFSDRETQLVGYSNSYARAAAPVVYEFDYELKHVDVEVRKVGNPLDNLVMTVRAEESNAPGAVLATVTMAGSTIGTAPTTERFTLATAYTLTAGSTFYVHFARSGANDAANYYALSCDEDNRNGSMQVFDETDDTWSSREPGATLAMTTISATGLEEVYAVARQRIHAPTNDLLDFKNEAMILVSGSASNDGQYTVDGQDDLDPGGSVMTLATGHRLTAEAAGATVTLTTGLKASQGFIFSTPWTMKYIDLFVSKVGAPSDNLVVQICASSGGLPGTVLASSTITAVAISEDQEWVRCTVPSTSIVADTLHHLVVSRSGSASMDNYFVIGVSEALAYTDGAMKLWSAGTGWVDRSPDADISFRLQGDEDTAGQVCTLLETAGQFFSAVDQEVSSLILTNPYRDGDGSALFEAEELLAIGTSSYRRMLARVDADRRVQIYEEPDAAQPYWIAADGSLADGYGVPVRKEQAPAGVWARLRDLIPGNVDLTKIVDPSLLFIEEAEYSRGRLQLIPRDMDDLWAIGRMSDG
jgi:hypothetical protein